MDVQEIINFIKASGSVEMPDIQERFGLTYTNTVKTLYWLEKRGDITYDEGFTYTWSSREQEKTYTPKNAEEAFFIKALWVCVQSGVASTSAIRLRCSVGSSMAVKALDWMEENGFISSENGTLPRNVLIGRDDFIQKFGEPGVRGFAGDMEEYIERRRRALIERLSHMDDGDDEDGDDDEDDDDADNDDDDVDGDSDDENGDDEDEDYYKAVKERREYFERRRAREEAEKAKQNRERDVADLRAETQRMPGYIAVDDTFSLKMKVEYPDGTPFRAKVIEHGGHHYVSDAGNTLKYLSLFNDKDMLAEYFRGTLKTENMCFIEDAVCTTIDDIHDLSGEASFLFKIINGLITQKYFDVYYLGGKLLLLAESILKETDAEMLVNTLSVLDERPVCVSALQKKLHIGHARATGLINTLTKLNILSSDGVKTDKISNGFIAYVRRMLDNRSDE